MELSAVSVGGDRDEGPPSQPPEGTDMHPPDPALLRQSKRSWVLRVPMRIRYFLIRLMSCPVPFLSARVPILGGRTAVEISLMAVVCAVVLRKSVRNFKKAGKVLDYLIALMIVLAMRSNILTLLFGVSFDRVIYVHKLMGALTMAVAAIHALNGLNKTGIVLLTFLCVMTAGYLVKPFFFEIFYYSHIISFIIIAPFAVIHDHKSKYGGYMSIAFAVDLFIRHVIRGKRVDAVEVSALPGGVVRLKFEKCFDYRPGQYCFLRVADIDRVEYHPVSISSAPGEAHTTFHIRALGDWTGRLLRSAQDRPDWAPSVHIEGPYGTPTVDLTGGAYQVILLISGGIGITPNQSIYNQLVLDHQNGRGQAGLRKVIFIWSVRDRAAIEALDKSLLPGAAQWAFRSGAPDGLDDTERADTSLLLPPSFQPTHVLASDAKAPDASSSNSGSLVGLSSPFIFHPAFFVTDGSSVCAAEGVCPGGGAGRGHSPLLHVGRPDLPRVFEQVAELCREGGRRRAAVAVCGPRDMTNEVQDLCRASLMDMSPGAVRFDCHVEAFDL